MKTSFKVIKNITDLLEKNELLWITQITQLTWLSRTIIHQWLKELYEEWKVEKIGAWAHVKYRSLIYDESKIEENNLEFNFDYKTQKLLQEYFLKFTPTWEKLIWVDWIIKWCISRNFDIEQKVRNFISIINHLDKEFNKCWLLDASKIFWAHFDEVFLDKTYYADQYNRMEFWRGKLAELTFYAKQSQNKSLINESIDEIMIKLDCFIKQEKFDAIAITPWSIDRKNQLLWVLKNRLSQMNLPFVNIIKYYPNNIAIPQKSLKMRSQRIENAKNTIFVNDNEVSKYKKVFLIDDFVWSGSTLNETAKKLKKEWVNEVIWFAFVWNLNLDYEVINEV